MRLEIQYENKKLGFEVSYRNRRTLAIQVSPMEKIQVFSPNGLSEDYIIEKVRSKGSWILKKFAEFKEAGFLPFKKQFVTGESFLYLGKILWLHVLLNSDLARPKIELTQNNIFICSPSKEQELIRESLRKWYKEEAKKIILKKVEHFSKICAANPLEVKIKEQKRRWGSCSFRGNIYFNWRIIMAPDQVIDYIVVHEIAHLIHKNHSPVFYKMVESILPDYKKRRKWLKDYGIRLDI